MRPRWDYMDLEDWAWVLVLGPWVLVACAGGLFVLVTILRAIWRLFA